MSSENGNFKFVFDIPIRFPVAGVMMNGIRIFTLFGKMKIVIQKGVRIKFNPAFFEVCCRNVVFFCERQQNILDLLFGLRNRPD